mmetsp:Transcript_34443/g.53769  ORF Transcript_34443/g.53769 Transcript_34443/m.53769 type:complete len:126 (-) Transcript_34443:511-888(-)
MILIDHFPYERFVENRTGLPYYNMSGLQLARAMTVRAFELDPTASWVQENAPQILSRHHPCYAEYRKQFGKYRPSQFKLDKKWLRNPNPPTPFTCNPKPGLSTLTRKSSKTCLTLLAPSNFSHPS